MNYILIFLLGALAYFFGYRAGARKLEAMWKPLAHSLYQNAVAWRARAMEFHDFSLDEDRPQEPELPTWAVK